MELSDFELYKLDLTHTIDNFDCGDADLNDFIINDAIQYSLKLLAVTYLLFKGGKLAAFFSLFVTNNRTGCMYLTVDAYRKSLHFYEKNDFKYLCKTDDGSNTRLMYYDLRELKK